MESLKLILFLVVAVSAVVAFDETMVDDEDTPWPNEDYSGDVTLEFYTQLDCSEWLIIPEKSEMRATILNELVSTVRSSCGCNFSSDYIILSDVSCPNDASSTMLFHVHFRNMDQTMLSVSDHDLLDYITAWVSNQPTFQFEVNEMQTLVTLTQAHSDNPLYSGSGSGDVTTVTPETAPTTNEATTPSTTKEIVTTAPVDITTVNIITSDVTTATPQAPPTTNEATPSTTEETTSPVDITTVNNIITSDVSKPEPFNSASCTLSSLLITLVLLCAAML